MRQEGILIFLCFFFACLSAGKHYQDTASVPFFVNKIGPYSNPSESYEYYSLPFCPPDKVYHKHSSIGEDFTGDHKVNTRYDIRFNVPIPWTSLCTVHLTKLEIEPFQKAIDKYYYFEMTYDDLPLRGFIGTKEENLDAYGRLEVKYYLFKHFHFSILRNGDQVIFINVTADMSKLHLLDEESTIEFSYSASWDETTWPYSKRMELFAQNASAVELEIHWLSIMNSCVLVLLLTGFLAIILMRILNNDYTRYSMEHDDEDQEEYGWKLVHGDVFRFPRFKNLFCALMGLGSQGFAITFFLLILALLGIFYPGNNGTIYVAGIILYALTCSLGGFVSARLYTQMESPVITFPAARDTHSTSFNLFSLFFSSMSQRVSPRATEKSYSPAEPTAPGSNPAFDHAAASSPPVIHLSGTSRWQWNAVLVSALFTVPLLAVFSFVNTTALAYGVTTAVPVSSVVWTMFLVVIVGFPLTVIGAISGRRSAPPFDAPQRPKKFAREIPPIPFYRRTFPQMLVAGFLPFSAIYIELFYMFNSVWGHSSYQLYGILAIVLVILFIVTACITIALVYFQLSMEDYRWWWTSFLNGGSAGIFIYAYAVYYYVYRSRMTGLLQGSFYFLYMAILCYFFFVMLGALGFFSSLVFVRRIYRGLKCD